jgi:protein-disulfide isomerase
MITLLRPAAAGVAAALFLCAMAVFALLAWPGAGARAEQAGMTKEQVEAIVRDYLLANPEILNEMIDRLQAKEAADAQGRAIAVLKERRAEVSNDGYSHVAGNINGDVTIVEFFDYNCGFCRKVLADLRAIMDEDKSIRLVLKELPILSEDSALAAKVAMAALKQSGDKYWDFHLRMLSHEGRMDEPTIFALAQASGLDVARLKTDMVSPEIAANLERNAALAQALGVDGTPAFVIGDKVISGAHTIEEFRQFIADARAKCETC